MHIAPDIVQTGPAIAAVRKGVHAPDARAAVNVQRGELGFEAAGFVAEVGGTARDAFGFADVVETGRDVDCAVGLFAAAGLRGMRRHRGEQPDQQQRGENQEPAAPGAM